MQELLKILNDNGIRYSMSYYAGYPSVVIKKNKYQLEIFKDEQGYVSDLHKIPYTWGIMGSTTIECILRDLCNYLEINIISLQLSLF